MRSWRATSATAVASAKRRRTTSSGCTPGRLAQRDAAGLGGRLRIQPLDDGRPAEALGVVLQVVAHDGERREAVLELEGERRVVELSGLDLPDVLLRGQGRRVLSVAAQ